MICERCGNDSDSVMCGPTGLDIRGWYKESGYACGSCWSEMKVKVDNIRKMNEDFQIIIGGC